MSVSKFVGVLKSGRFFQALRTSGHVKIEVDFWFEKVESRSSRKADSLIDSSRTISKGLLQNSTACHVPMDLWPFAIGLPPLDVFVRRL